MSLGAISLPYTSVFDNLFYDNDRDLAGTDDNEQVLDIVGQGLVPNVKSATELFTRLLNADYKSALNRTAIQAMFDNAPPYNEQQLHVEGTGYLANFNPGDAKAALDAAMAAYVDLLGSVRVLMDISTKWGGEDQKEQWEQVMAEEFTRALRKWAYWDFNFLNLSQNFIGHGVGIAYFQDDENWMFKTSGFGDFLIPRMTQSNEEEIELAICQRNYLPHQLIKMIRKVNPDPNWNADQVETAVAEAFKGTSYSGAGPDTTNIQPELIETTIKNNDLNQSYATNTYIRTIHLWVRENDGTVTHLISLASGTNDDFLYKKKDCFPSMARAFTFFTFGIGNNGFYHSIRGMGHKIFNKAQCLARGECRLFDSAFLSSSIIVQPEDENALQDTALAYIGQCAVLSPDAKIVPYNFPDVGKNVLPVLSEMRALLSNDVGQYANPAVIDDGSDKTKFQVKAELGESAKVSSTSLTLFYDSMQKLMTNVIRRFSRRGYRQDEPGGKEVWDFIVRCMKRGVPIEAIYGIDPEDCQVVRALGAGSEAARLVAFDEMMQMAPYLPPQGRENLVRDWFANQVGYQKVDRYIPQNANQDSNPVQTKMAILENKDLMVNSQIPVLPEEAHAIHIPIHLQQLQGLQASIEADQSTLQQLFPAYMATLNHTIPHVQYLSQDKFYATESAQYRKILQQANEIAYNGYEELQKQDKEVQAKAAAGQPITPQGPAGSPQGAPQGAIPSQLPPQGQVALPDPITPGSPSSVGQPGGEQFGQLNDRLQEKIIQNRLSLQNTQEQHQLILQQNAEKFAQQLSFADAKNAKKIIES